MFVFKLSIKIGREQPAENAHPYGEYSQNELAHQETTIGFKANHHVD